MSSNDSSYTPKMIWPWAPPPPPPASILCRKDATCRHACSPKHTCTCNIWKLIQWYNTHWGGTDPVLAVRRRVVDPVPKRNIYTIMYILFFDHKSGQYVSKHRHFTMVWYVKGISAKNLASKRALSVFFVIIHQQQKTRFRHVHLSARPCSVTSMHVPVQKRAGDQY